MNNNIIHIMNSILNYMSECRFALPEGPARGFFGIACCPWSPSHFESIFLFSEIWHEIFLIFQLQLFIHPGFTMVVGSMANSSFHQCPPKPGGPSQHTETWTPPRELSCFLEPSHPAQNHEFGMPVSPEYCYLTPPY